jgi:TonB family protein
MRRAGILMVAAALFAALFTALSTRTSMAQAPAHAERKAVSRVDPFYPEMAKRMHLGGVVKLEAVVRPNGTVKSAKPLGGSPVLIEAARVAVLKWRFEVTPEETTELVQVTFELP